MYIFFCNFPVAGNEKKKETKKKIKNKFGAEIWNLATAQIVLQE